MYGSVHFTEVFTIYRYSIYTQVFDASIQSERFHTMDSRVRCLGHRHDCVLSGVLSSWRTCRVLPGPQENVTTQTGQTIEDAR